ncbi:hypothetical protein GCM10009037_13560 [Halarchaeum grantii]|uniref:Uncharacterized protein n=1 Tax=Halarchaeum grantii TaxID=1193105 RepID=A0A830F1T6_9EURY|nr:hypothetical protein [Halarchaeum grantii]GGL31110.1 hypothetical protein GCM10009037_13560 [Halarchaeum grantii]
MKQTRRRVLAALGFGVVGSLAGCTGASSAPDEVTTDETTTTPPDFSGCPSLRETADETVCAATAPADAPVVLAPSRADVAAPGTLRFTLTNDSEASLGLNPYDWALHRETDGGWERVAPDAVIQPWFTLAPGESRTWELQIGGGHSAPQNDSTVVAGPLDLEPGTYAFSVVAVGEARTAYVARFRVR